MTPPRVPCLLLVVALLAGTRASVLAQEGAPVPDPYHPVPKDTVDASTYEGWKRFRLLCDRCHGEEARGTTFGPDLLPALRPEGSVPSEQAFIALMHQGRPDKGMPSAERLGLSEEYFAGLYAYLLGRSNGRYAGGRPARRVN